MPLTETIGDLVFEINRPVIRDDTATTGRTAFEIFASEVAHDKGLQWLRDDWLQSDQLTRIRSLLELPMPPPRPTLVDATAWT